MLVILSELETKVGLSRAEFPRGRSSIRLGPKMNFDSVQLIRQIADGNKTAFRKLYAEFSKPLAGFLSRRTNQTEQVEEILQEIFIAVWKKAGYFDARKGNAEQWIYTIARNKLYDHWRKIGRLGEFIQSDWEQFSNKEQLVPTESSVSLETALRTISEDQRQIIKLIYMEGYTQKECSKKLGQPLGTIKWKISKALTLLKRELEKENLRFRYETSS